MFQKAEVAPHRATPPASTRRRRPGPVASALGLLSERESLTPALARSQHHKGSEQHSCGMFQGPEAASES